MRILFYLHQFPAFGGIETVTAMLAAQFAQDGHRVEIISFRSSEGSDLLDKIPPNSWRSLPCGEIEDSKNKEALLECLLAFEPNVIIFQDSYAKIEKTLSSTVENYRQTHHVFVVVAEHSMPRVAFPYRFCLRNARDIVRDMAIVLFAPLFYLRQCRIERERRRYVMRLADKYVVLTERYISKANRIAGQDNTAKMVAIANPICVHVAPIMDKKQKNVVFCGSLIKLKGVSRLINIWSELEPAFRDWTFTIVGDGCERSQLVNLVQTLGLKNVEFTGFQKDPVPFYRRASIIVMASSFEGWPMVLGESMRCGCVPVVYDSFEASHDIIDDGESGFIVPCYNKGAFICKLEQLMSDEKRRAEMSIRAIAKSSSFNIDFIAKNWYNLFQTTLPCADE